jgi:hypothetical protein
MKIKMPFFCRCFAILIFLLFALPAPSQNIVTTVVTVTNVAGTVSGETFSINGNLRTCVNLVTAANIQIQATNAMNAAATNLYLSYIMVPQANVQVRMSAANAVTFTSFPGDPLVILTNTSPVWCTLVTTTVPISGSYTAFRGFFSGVGVDEQTNTANGIVSYLGSLAVTNAIPTNAPAMSNFVSNFKLSVTQTNFTNFALSLSTNATNFALALSANGTNFALTIGASGSNYAALVSLTNALTVSTNATNFALLLSTNATNFALMLSTNATNFSTNYANGKATDATNFTLSVGTLITNYVIAEIAGVTGGLSYLDGFGNIVLSDSTPQERIRANHGGVLEMNYSDGALMLLQNTDNSVYLYDHDSGNSRLEILDGGSGGQTILRSHTHNDGVTIGSVSDSVLTRAPVSFGGLIWPATVVGTTTNFIGQAQNTGTGDTTVDSYSIPANTLTNNGDGISRVVGISYAAHSATKQSQVYFAGTQIIDTGAVANTGAGACSITCEVTILDCSTLTSATVAYNCTAIAAGTSTTPFVKVGKISGVDLTAGVSCYVVLTAGSGGSTGDIVVISDNSKRAPSSLWGGLN